MRELDYHSITLSMQENNQEVNQDFPRIEGRVIGMATHVVGTRPDKSIRLTLRENGSDRYRPIDISFSETEGRSGFESSLLKLNIPNPGRLTGALIADAPLANGEDFKLEVILVSEKPAQESAGDNFC